MGFETAHRRQPSDAAERGNLSAASRSGHLPVGARSGVSTSVAMARFQTRESVHLPDVTR
jgi:hypothetical protein